MRSRRLVDVVGAGAFGLMALGLALSLRHPSEIYAYGRSPCDGHSIADALAYAGGAAVATAAALSAIALLRRRAPSWLGAVGIGLAVLVVATQRTRTFGCVGEADFGPAQDVAEQAVGLASIAVAAVVLGWFLLDRRRGSDEPSPSTSSCE